MDINGKSSLNDIIYLFPVKFKNMLFNLNDGIKTSLREIRLRSEKPIVLVTAKGSAFLTSDSRLTYILSENLPVFSKEDLQELVKRACNYSVYSYQEQINSGFISLKGGHRLGVCGTAVKENGRTVSVRNINSINIRFAREIYGSADKVFNIVFDSHPHNTIIAGPPLSGKTTVLRDLIRQASSGNAGVYYKCAVVDERNELAGVSGGISGCRLGPNTDILSGYSKAEAIEIAIRTLSPDIVFCDEIASEAEAKQVKEGIMCGVHFVVTAHCFDYIELIGRKGVSPLIANGLFRNAVILGTGENVGAIKRIYRIGSNKNEKSRYFDFSDDMCFERELLRRIN